jgi:folate-binding protein YgfZ
MTNTNQPFAKHDGDGYTTSLDYGLIEVYGLDAERFLHAQTTSDVKGLPQLTGQPSALLDRKAHIQAYFTLFRKHDSFRILASRLQIEDIIAHLDKFRFADKVEFLDLSQSGQFIALFGLHSRKLLVDTVKKPHGAAIFENGLVDATMFGKHVHIFAMPVAAEEVFFIWVKNEDWSEVVKDLGTAAGALGLSELGARAVKEMRIEAGVPLFGIDFDNNNLIIELGIEDKAVSYTKGCFQGQEVLARVKAGGTPAKQLTGLTFIERGKGAQAQDEWPLGTKLMVKGQEAAQIYSNCYCKKLGKIIALAFVKKDKRVVDTIIEGTVDGEPVKAKVTLLPFVEAQDMSAHAHSLYEEALKMFADGDSEKAQEAVALLKEAIILNPTFEDAYEALGVILSKVDQVDEAIEWMQRLIGLNQDSVMAHANLSVFYLEKGDKDKAEEEKAESMSIRMRLAARDAVKNKKEKEDEVKAAAEANERMVMFNQVLEIDPDDLLANYGVGTCYNALKQYDKAVTVLQKALTIKDTHTQAYLELGRAYEGLGEKAQAVEAYTKGVAVASQKGDMTPLKEMQAGLARLNA